MATKKTFVLRLDPELYAALEHWSSDEFRSVNGHIEFLLKEALKKTQRLQRACCAHCERKHRPGVVI